MRVFGGMARWRVVGMALAACKPDADGDGFATDEDCDDSNAELGGPERPGDGLDNDCDGAVDCGDPDLVPPGAVWEGHLDEDDLPGFCDGYECRTVTGELGIVGSDLTDASAQALVDEIDSIGGFITVFNN